MSTYKFMEAATRLAALCDQIEDIDNFDQIKGSLIEDFASNLKDVATAIDRQRMFINEIESKIMAAEQRRDDSNDAVKKFKRLRAAAIEATKLTVEANPAVVFRDKLGKALTIVNNSAPSLKIDGDWLDSEYAVKSEVVELDKDRLKRDLLDGKIVPFAKLERGTHLRGL